MYDAEKAANLSQIRSELARRTVSRIEQEIAELAKQIDAKRKEEAAESVRATQEAALAAHSDLKPEADRNAELARENQQLSEEISAITEQSEQVRKQLADLNALAARTKEKVARVGLTGAIGLELRRQIRSLPNVAAIRAECRTRQRLMRDIEYKRLGHEDDRRALNGSDQNPNLDPETLKILTDRGTTLDTLLRNYNDYFNKLSQVDADQQQLIKETYRLPQFYR